jgi:hypothetical protein
LIWYFDEFGSATSNVVILSDDGIVCINICYFSVNRRLDEWVDIEKVDLSTLNYENSRKDSVSSGVQLLDVSNGSDRKVTRNQKRKHDEVNHIQKVILFVTLTEYLLSRSGFY